MGGEKRKVTMVMADLRGFTSLSERLAPKWVVSILNRYFDTMVKIVKRYDGTIDEFIGDAIFILFGAPTWREDDARRAVACAIEMQLAMAAINEQNRLDDLPELRMGIGIHTGQVVVGNIGSPERMKYGVVGSHVNLTSRIQSYTAGDQILVSEATRRDVGRILKIGKQMEVRAKGFEQPVTLSEVRSISGPYKLALYQTKDDFVTLANEIPISYAIVDGEHLDAERFHGSLTGLSLRRAEARLEKPVPDMGSIEIYLIGTDGKEIPGSLYGKVSESATDNSNRVSLTLTSMSPEIETFLRGYLGTSKGASSMPHTPAVEPQQTAQSVH
jgi:adenylate cyclase